MTARLLRLLPLLAVASLPLRAQDPPFDLLIRNGHVIDPKNGIDAVLDVAIAGGKIAAVAASIDPARARAVANAGGLYVTPGLIDIHAHVFWGTDNSDDYRARRTRAVSRTATRSEAARRRWSRSAAPDGETSRSSKTQVIDRAKTRVLSFLNIVGRGMTGGPEEQDLLDMDAKLTALRIRQHPGLIVGVKVAHYDGHEWDPVTRAVEAGREANVPVMVDFGGQTPPLSLEDLLLKYLRPGDILTHTYAHVAGRIPDRGRGRESSGPYVLAARKRGIIFDAGHGGGASCSARPFLP